MKWTHSFLALLLVACAADDSPVRSDGVGKFDDPTANDADMLPLRITITYTVGDMDETGDVDIDDSGSFFVDDIVTLGPISECIKPIEDADPLAACSWVGPSSHWKTNIWITSPRNVPTLSASAFTGLLETFGGSRLPIASVPESGRWSFEHNPEDPDGVHGGIEITVQKLLTGSDLEPLEE